MPNTNDDGTSRIRIEVEVCGLETISDDGVTQALKFNRGTGTNNATYIDLTT